MGTLVDHATLRVIPAGPERDAYLPLIRLADDSEQEVQGYYQRGTLYALDAADGTAIGVILAIPEPDGPVELKAVAVAEPLHGKGIGTHLLHGVLAALRTAGVRRVVVGTSSSGIGQLAYYQKAGFRLLRIERDFFQPGRGYPDLMEEHGIRVRDMVWMDQDLVDRDGERRSSGPGGPAVASDGSPGSAPQGDGPTLDADVPARDRPHGGAARPAVDDGRSDIELARSVATTLTRPRVDEADSFVLHAPLELLARTALLPMVRPDQRSAARRRIAGIAERYEAFGPGLADPEPVDLSDGRRAAARLHAAIEAGDLDDVDRVAAWIGRTTDPRSQRVLLADEIIPRLSAAAHGPIYLYLLPRVSPRGELPGDMLRSLAREVAREPTWRLTWPEHLPVHRRPGRPGALFDAVASAPRLGVPGTEFIHPVMAQLEHRGRAAALLGDAVTAVDVDQGARELLRAAALSMVHEPPEFAPYGWSHCLTMTQAVLALVLSGAATDPVTGLAVAAHFVAGFRSAFAARDVPASYEPDRTGVDPVEALDAGPELAAASAWHHPDDRAHELVAELATRAAVHHDAHLAKYTLACLDAAAWDPTHAPPVPVGRRLPPRRLVHPARHRLTSTDGDAGPTGIADGVPAEQLRVAR